MSVIICVYLQINNIIVISKFFSYTNVQRLTFGAYHTAYIIQYGLKLIEVFTCETL